MAAQVSGVIRVMKPNGNSEITGTVVPEKLDTLHFKEKAELMPLLTRVCDMRLLRSTSADNTLGILLCGPPSPRGARFMNALAAFLNRSICVLPRESCTPRALELALCSAAHVAVIEELHSVPGMLDSGRGATGGAAAAVASAAVAAASAPASPAAVEADSGCGGGAAAFAVDALVDASVDTATLRTLAASDGRDDVCDASFVLELLSGSVSREGCCAVFCTTRKPEEFLPEMLRSGRIDIVVRMES